MKFERINNILYASNILHKSHSPSAHLAAYVTFGSLILIVAMLAFAAIDGLLFNGSLRPLIEKILGVGLTGFGVGCLLILLSSNEIILCFQKS